MDDWASECHGRARRGATSRGRARFPSRNKQQGMLSQQLLAMQLQDAHFMTAAASPAARGNSRQRSASASAVPAQFQFSVASYNVLAQNLLEENSYLYRHCDEQHLYWNYRRQNIMQQLKRHRPDIICLQEVQYEHYLDFFYSQLQQCGYNAEYKKKTGDRLDGCATFYKCSKFVCCNSVPVEFKVSGCPVLDRHNVALLLLLEPIVRSDARAQACGTGSSSCICVANTHLLYNPGRGDVKLAQLMFLFAAIDEVAGITAEPCPKYHPVILCGDFNIELSSELYDFIVTGSLDFEGLHIKTMSGQKSGSGGRRLNSSRFLLPEIDVTDFCQFFEITEHRKKTSKCRRHWRSYEDSFLSGSACHSLHLVSAYDESMPQTVTAWLGGPSHGAFVDYIFYSAAMSYPASKFRTTEPNILTLIQVLHLPSEEQLEQSGGLPNDTESSDHLMLMAWFSMHTE